MLQNATNTLTQPCYFAPEDWADRSGLPCLYTGEVGRHAKAKLLSNPKHQPAPKITPTLHVVCMLQKVTARIGLPLDEPIPFRGHSVNAPHQEAREINPSATTLISILAVPRHPLAYACGAVQEAGYPGE